MVQVPRGRRDAAVPELPRDDPDVHALDAQLGRVHVPRLTLRAQGRAHDETLVRELASTFRGAVQDAYREGERRLRVLRGVVV